MKDIKDTLADFGVHFDVWFSERSLHEDTSHGSVTDTLKGLDGFRISEPRVVALKGIAEPVQVVSLDWR